MIITNSRYALVGYFITSYPTRAHGIIVKYFTFWLPDYVRYIEEFVITRFVISRFYSIHFTVILAGTKSIVCYICISRTSLNRGSLNRGSTVYLLYRFNNAACSAAAIITHVWSRTTWDVVS